MILFKAVANAILTKLGGCTILVKKTCYGYPYVAHLYTYHKIKFVALQVNLLNV